MDTPRTSVVLVGRNPTPALLSALTLPHDHLVLAGSDDTLPTAHRVAEAVRARTAPASVHVMSVGPDPHDPDGVVDHLRALETVRGARPWYLDYTGGTKIMSVAAALLHEQTLPETDHPRAPGWRLYLDPRRDLLRTADPHRPALPVDTSRVDLAALAAVHGSHWIEDRDPEPVRLVAEGGTQALDARHPRLGPAARRGIIAEARVLAHLRRHLRRAPDTEVLGPRRVADPARPGDSVADFDAVVRHRHRVLCVETKTRADDVEARAGWTLAKARRVFGNAVCVLFVHTGPADPRLRAAMFDHNPALTAPNTHVWALDDLLRRLTSFDDLRSAFFPGLAPAPTETVPHPPLPTAPAPPGHHPGPGSAPALVTALGGSRLGTLTAVHAHRPARTLILSSRQGIREHVREAAARTLHRAEHPGAPPADAAHLEEHGYRDRVRFGADPVDGSDPHAVAARAHAWITGENGRPAVADLTTGTKAMSLGLALAARHSGACATYQLPRERALVCLTHGRVPLHARAAVDWSLVLSGYTPLTGPLTADPVHVDAALLEAARTALTRATADPVEVWADTTLADPERAHTARERPSLVLTCGDRAVGLAAPAWRRRRPHDRRTRRVSPGAWAQSVHAATLHLNLRCDVAGTVLALTRPGGDVGRARELVDWITHTPPGARPPEPRLTFGDPLHPLVLAAAPDDPPAPLHTDLSLL
ncbi:hypothetical protein GCM10007147_28830 [Nocardiopsis kunsanensis]|uniref:Uncharacterized protein n=1 Tax=Nocardiopsis kunsanensis TaxID=141693 RepID=A0A918XEA7_9ACTN|nr:hypothetical protein GCM10007147_28830 [Nocardiopsis kunsanensis]